MTSHYSNLTLTIVREKKSFPSKPFSVPIMHIYISSSFIHTLLCTLTMQKPYQHFPWFLNCIYAYFTYLSKQKVTTTSSLWLVT